MKKAVQYVSALLLLGFGLLTLYLSGSVIFDLFEIRAEKGNYVLFIVWANFISSLIYLIAAYGFLKSKKWTAGVLSISVLVLVLAFVGLNIYANAGGLYETKTMNAMIFRTTVTLIFTALAYLFISKKKRDV